MPSLSRLLLVLLQLPFINNMAKVTFHCSWLLTYQLNTIYNDKAPEEKAVQITIKLGLCYSHHHLRDSCLKENITKLVCCHIFSTRCVFNKICKLRLGSISHVISTCLPFLVSIKSCNDSQVPKPVTLCSAEEHKNWAWQKSYLGTWKFTVTGFCWTILIREQESACTHLETRLKRNCA